MDANRKAGENEELTIDLYEILYLFRQKIVFIIIALLVGGIDTAFEELMKLIYSLFN